MSSVIKVIYLCLLIYCLVRGLENIRTSLLNDWVTVVLQLGLGRLGRMALTALFLQFCYFWFRWQSRSCNLQDRYVLFFHSDLLGLLYETKHTYDRSLLYSLNTQRKQVSDLVIKMLGIMHVVIVIMWFGKVHLGIRDNHSCPIFSGADNWLVSLPSLARRRLLFWQCRRVKRLQRFCHCAII